MNTKTLILGLLAALAIGCDDDGETGSPVGGADRSGTNAAPGATPPRSDPDSLGPSVPAPGHPTAMTRPDTGEAAPDSATGPGGTPAPAGRPSFDCEEARGTVEQLICATPELARLDVRLDSIWQEVLRLMDEGGMPDADRATLRAFQRGWIGGRNECWKSDDVEGCVRDLYRTRIARLQSDWQLAPGGEPTFWACQGNPANEFVLTFFETDPPSVRVERGDRQETMLAVPVASGTRYLGFFGKEVWMKGDTGTFVWPQTDTLRCVLRRGSAAP